MGRVIVVGSINVDFTVRVPRLPRAGETVTGGTFQRAAGGKGANQAVAAARYGAVAMLIAQVGDDELGEASCRDMRAEGMDLTGIVTATGTPTGIALIVVDPSGDNQIAVASGANGALTSDVIAGRLAGLDASADDVMLTGFELPDDAVEEAVAWAITHSVRVIINPAPARPLRGVLLSAEPILTPNEHEAADLTNESDPERAARVLQARTHAAVVVTLGAAGALLLDERRVTHLPALRVVSVDSTGAGDALNGILGAELASGASLMQAARAAVAGASLSTQQAGARAGLPSRAEVEAALRATLEPGRESPDTRI